MGENEFTDIRKPGNKNEWEPTKQVYSIAYKPEGDASPSEGSVAVKTTQYLATICATISAFSLGNSFAWSSPASIPLRNGTYISGVPLSSEEEAWVASLMPLGAAASSIPIGFLMDKFGRKTSLLSLVVPFTIGWAMVIWPLNIEFLFVGRFLLGIAGGAVGAATPVYSAEVAMDDNRGALGSYFEIMLTLGIAVVYGVGGLVSLFTLSLFCGFVPLVFFGTFYFMPETPLYLMTKHKEDDARKSLRFLRGARYDIEPEMVELRDRVSKVQSAEVSFFKAFSATAARRGLTISLGLMIVQQLSGIDPLTFYISYIFTTAGSSLSPDASSTIYGFVECSATFLSSFLVDRLGRRILLISSTFVMACMTVFLGLFFFLKETDHDVSSITWLPLISLCVFVIAFSFGIGPIPWTMVGELFPPNIQGSASGVTSCLNWLLGFTVSKVYVNMKEGFGDGITFWIFSAFLFFGTVFIYIFVIETKGKTIEQIQRDLGEK